MRIIVTGSIAYDYLMSFPGSFSEHLLPDHLKRVSLSFLVDSMDKRRGGCAPNIAYTLALLGERPMLMGTAGQDFDEYRQWLDAAGIDTSLVRQVPGKFTASFFCSTDRDGNQIASFYTGAMAHAAELTFAAAGGCDLAIISPNDPTAMVEYARECQALDIPYIYDPSQQVARMGGDDIKAGVVGAHIVIGNDYEFAIIREKTGLDEAAMLAARDGRGGDQGREGRVDHPARPHHRHSGRPARRHRRSHGRGRRLPRRLHEGDGVGRGLRDVRPARQRGRRPTRWSTWAGRATLHDGRVRRPLPAALRRVGAVTPARWRW